MPPVVVTVRGLEKLIPRTEVPALESLAGDSEQVGLKEMKNALAKLREAEEKTGSRQVMVTAQDADASRLQSAIAEGEIEPNRLEPLPTGGLEAKFDEQDWPGWATVAWSKIKNLKNHPLLKPRSAAAIPFAEEGRIALVGDWGTGLYGAPVIAKTVEADADRYAMLFHLGDVYYSGTKREVRERFLDIWPKRPGAVMRALNSNHEMYSGGHAYFEDILPAFGQDASYFAFQNTHWTLIGLDVAHKDHAINERDFPDQQVNWLKGILSNSGNRKVILFSHHQLFSHYDAQGDKLWADHGFAEVLRSKRIFAWYWGHEHRCCIYEEPDPRSGLWARCLGHGGMPESRNKTVGLPSAPELDRADWRRIPAKKDANGNGIPGAVVLEGPNPYLGDEAEKFLPHGFGTLVLDGARLTEYVRDCEGRIIFENKLAR
jgi:hypothetical protein